MKRTYLVVFVMLVPLSPVWCGSAAGPMCPEPPEGGSGQAACGLGTRWNVVAGCWDGVYVRRGSSNTFDAQMTLVNGQHYAATVVVTINGGQVSATQTDTAGEPCYLRNGTLDADGRTVRGTYECHPSGRPVTYGCFIGSIQCGGSGNPPPPAPTKAPAPTPVGSCAAIAAQPVMAHADFPQSGQPRGWDYSGLSAPTAQACCELCKKVTRFQCKSFFYRPDTGWCYPQSLDTCSPDPSKRLHVVSESEYGMQRGRLSYYELTPCGNVGGSSH